MQRQIILDTETTGLSPEKGDRLIEIGCLELVNRKLSGRSLHLYVNPDRLVGEGALKVHGISNDFLEDKPRFYEVVEEIMEFIAGAELIIHNAEFDLGFLNYELSLLRRNPYGRIQDHATVLDTLVLARQLHPGQRNSLDALCKRYQVNNTHRTLHGALLDAEILANVYLLMTGGQEQLFVSDAAADEATGLFTTETKVSRVYHLRPVLA
jgi:DNA polymerase-3 subunit epsilon